MDEFSENALKGKSEDLDGVELVLTNDVPVDEEFDLNINSPRGDMAETFRKQTVNLHDYHVDGSWTSIAFTALVGLVGIAVIIWPPRGSYYTGVVLLALCFLRSWEISKIHAPRWPVIEILTFEDEQQFSAADAWNDEHSWCPAFWIGMVMWALPAKVFGSLLIALFLEWLTRGFRLFVLADYITSVPAVAVTIFVEHFASWTQHYSGHKVPFFWRYIHQLHHAPARYNVWLSLWHHPYELTAYGFKHWVVSIFLFGLTDEELFWTVVIVNIQGWFVHANIRTPWLLGFITTRPESHVIHHAEPYPRPKDFQRKNFSDCPIWDIVFGTFENPKDDPREDPNFKIGYSQRTGLWMKQMIGAVDIKEMREKMFHEFPGSPAMQDHVSIVKSIRASMSSPELQEVLAGLSSEDLQIEDEELPKMEIKVRRQSLQV